MDKSLKALIVAVGFALAPCSGAAAPFAPSQSTQVPATSGTIVGCPAGATCYGVAQPGGERSVAQPRCSMASRSGGCDRGAGGLIGGLAFCRNAIPPGRDVSVNGNASNAYNVTSSTALFWTNGGDGRSKFAYLYGTQGEGYFLEPFIRISGRRLEPSALSVTQAFAPIVSIGSNGASIVDDVEIALNLLKDSDPSLVSHLGPPYSILSQLAPSAFSSLQCSPNTIR